MSSFVFDTRAALDNAIDAWIDNQTSATSVYGVINSWDVSNIQDFKGLFKNKLSFNSNISNWDVNSGTDFSEMFYGASSFNQDIGNWNVSSSLIEEKLFDFFSIPGFQEDFINSEHKSQNAIFGYDDFNYFEIC
tara:strand:- start:889 stop:1290 length:402 start_codon:yes stop_codon:yes gene_type:complete